ncbi:MAG TPA: ABC transporter substrate-binding protein [Acidimicrobiales bacterium]|jgi:ABC-type branched-subunit amino acid transport system substrate-binding protein|nr:ABC transporter substrate-binding protein [Acidimicrobiales bacterium]
MSSKSPTTSRRVGAVLAALALLGAACGSSSKGTSGAGGGGGATAPGVTATTINIGATVPLTGPAAPGYSEIAPAANAVFKWVNAHGGVNGRRIHYDYVDDGYNPSVTATKTRQLVLQDNIFADVGPLGTPTQTAVQPFLNAQKVPQLFIESGCTCWNNPKYPESFGWQPNYLVEGKILGQYIKDHFAGMKVGYLYQNDDFGQGFDQGLDAELPASSVVSRQSYDSATLSGPLSNQVAALKAAGAQVVAMATIPAATALAMLPAAAIGYSPQFVVSNVGADPPTVAPLLASFSKGKAGETLLNGMISDAYLPPEADTSNPWIQVSKKLLADYDSGAPVDGNTVYGVGLGYTFVQALQKAGKDLTRTDLVSAIENDSVNFVTPGLTPLTYSRTDHYGYSGGEVVKIENGAASSVSPIYVTANTGPITISKVTPSVPPANLVSTA